MFLLKIRRWWSRVKVWFIIWLLLSFLVLHHISIFANLIIALFFGIFIISLITVSKLSLEGASLTYKLTMSMVSAIFKLAVINLIIIAFDFKIPNHLSLLELPLVNLATISMNFHTMTMFLKIIKFSIINITIIIIYESLMYIILLSHIPKIYTIRIFLNLSIINIIIR